MSRFRRNPNIFAINNVKSLLNTMNLFDTKRLISIWDYFFRENESNEYYNAIK